MKSGEKRLFLVILVIALGLTGVALYPVWQQKQEEGRKAIQEVTTPRKLILGDARHSRGPADARFVLVEFADFTCTHCADAAPYLDQLVRAHSGDLRHVLRPIPIERHDSARMCVRAGEAASSQGRFWEMESGLFARRGRKTEEDVESIARAAGLDMARFRRDMASPQAAALMEQNLAAAEAVGLTITPTFFFMTPRHTYRIMGVDYLKQFLGDPSHWQ